MLKKPRKKFKKIKKTKTRKPHQQSAVLPIYKNKVVLVTTRRSGRWVIPKGVMEPGMTPQESAAQEALEEAGLKGRVPSKEIGHYKYRKWGRGYQVQVYVMKVQKMKNSWKEQKLRKRKLVKPKVAARTVSPKSLQRIIKAYFE